MAITPLTRRSEVRPSLSGPAPTSSQQVRLSRIFDLAVAVAGGGLAVAATASLWRQSEPIEPALFLTIPVIMVLGWFPLLLAQRRTSGGMEIGMDVSALIFLATTTTIAEALVVWSIGTTLAQCLRRKPRLTRAFNAGIGIVAAAVALLAIDVARAGEITAPRELLAMGVGATVFFLTDVLVTAVALSLEDSTRLGVELKPTGGIAALATSLATSSLGYLAALVVPALPGWASVLLVVPVATIVIASRAQSRGVEHARRLRVLLETAMRVQTIDDRPALIEVIRTSATELVHDSRVRLGHAAPVLGEIGVVVHDPSGDFWIVAPTMSRAQSTASDDENGLGALAAVAQDALARLHLSHAMSHLAWHDPVTGLSNRAFFMDRVEHAIEESASDRAPSAVLFCDLDGFKRVNDLFGHNAGDQLLTEVGRRLCRSVRPVDTVSRLGGDEFAVLMEHVRDPGDVERVCRKILRALRDPVHLIGGDVSVSTSIGVAWSTTDASADALLSRADLAMYYAKSAGKDRFETYRATFGEERRLRLEMVERLRQAIRSRHLEVFYQPVVELQTREILGVEALVRWRKDGVLISPNLFVATAEESGLVVALDELVLDIVTADAPRLRAAAGKTISIGVNVSAKHLQAEGFVSRIESARRRMGDVHFILEVTEREIVNPDSSTMTTMAALAAADVRFAIDDFGVGFSSIGYLQRLPVRIIKVDMSFIQQIDQDARACALVRSIVVMSDALGLDLVMEGIERETQLTHLLTHTGARMGQGYLFARPMTVTDMAAVLAGQQSGASIAHDIAKPLPGTVARL